MNKFVLKILITLFFITAGSLTYADETFSNDFVKNIIEINNKNSWVKFMNYPEHGNILISLYKDNKQHFVSFNDGKISLDVIGDDFRNYYHSRIAMYNILGITYPKPDPIAEDVSVDGNDLVFKYMRGYKYHDIMSDFSKNYINIAFDDISSPDYIKQIINENNKISDVKFFKYPDEGIWFDDKKIVICKKNGNKIINRKDFSDIYVPGTETIIYKKLHLSFNNPDRIFVKNKENQKWGILDSNLKQIADYQYDVIFELKLDDPAIFKTSKNKKILNITYKKDKNKRTYIVIKNGLMGVIDDNNNVILPLRKINNNIFYMQNISNKQQKFIEDLSNYIKN